MAGALAVSWSAQAQECPDAAVLTLAGVDGERLPSNAVLRGRYVHTLPAGLAVRDADSGVAVDFVVEDAPPLDGFGGRGWVGIRAIEGAWPSGRELEVVTDDGAIAAFTVESWSDTEAPEPPVVGEAFVVQTEVDAGRVREFVIPLEKSASEPVTYEVRFAEKTGAFAGTPLRVDGSTELVFQDGPCGGEAVAHFDPTMFFIEVTAVDHAGNASRATVGQPASVKKRGCDTGGAPWFMGWIALVAARRRSRG